MKPRIFIGSSEEGKRVAEAIQINFHPEAESKIWDQGVFDLSKNNLENLANKVADFDFAVFVFTPDDDIEIRGQNYKAARDNVIFETGLFIGKIGRDRTFFVLPSGQEDFRLPSDLLGVSAVNYDPDEFEREGRSALGVATAIMKESILRLGTRRFFAPGALRLTSKDMRAFYRSSGLTYAFKQRRESIERMLEDIRSSHSSLEMYARVYISNLIKNPDLVHALRAVACAQPKQSPEPFVVRHVSTGYEDRALTNLLWKQEDPHGKIFNTISVYESHLKRSDREFEARHEELKETLAALDQEKRRSFRFERSYIVNWIMPYSLVVIDRSIIYVSFYSIAKKEYGSFAPTMRLVCDASSCDSWATLFLEAKAQIDQHLSQPGQAPSPI